MLLLLAVAVLLRPSDAAQGTVVRDSGSRITVNADNSISLELPDEGNVSEDPAALLARFQAQKELLLAELAKRESSRWHRVALSDDRLLGDRFDGGGRVHLLLIMLLLMLGAPLGAVLRALTRAALSAGLAAYRWRNAKQARQRSQPSRSHHHQS